MCQSAGRKPNGLDFRDFLMIMVKASINMCICYTYTLFENDSITDINYPELLTAFYHYII